MQTLLQEKKRPELDAAKTIGTFSLQLKCQRHRAVGMANLWHVSVTARDGFPLNGRYWPPEGGQYWSHHSTTSFCVDLGAMVF